MEKLSDDILFDILVRLPIPSLVQFKCINKKWLSLISSRQFMRAKLKTSLHQHPSSCNRLLLGSNPVNSVNYEALVQEEEQVVATATVELDYPVRTPAEKLSISFAGSCDGLVFLLLEDEANNNDVSLILWNPATRQSRVLPKPRNINVSLNGEFFYGLGYNYLFDDYKIIVGRCCDGPTAAEAEIFSTGTSIWKEREGYCNCRTCYESLHCPGKVTEEGIYCHGNLHWLSYDQLEEAGNKCAIVSFSMRDERFEYDTIPLPCVGYDPDGLGVTDDDRLFVYNGENSLDMFEVWIMKDYGVGSSWSKDISFSTEGFPADREWTRFITFTRDKKKMVFNFCGWELCMYDPEQRTYTSFEHRNQWDFFYTCITYVESLLSPYDSYWSRRPWNWLEN